VTRRSLQMREQTLLVAHRKLLAAKGPAVRFHQLQDPRAAGLARAHGSCRRFGKLFIGVAPILKYIFWGGLALGLLLLRLGYRPGLDPEPVSKSWPDPIICVDLKPAGGRASRAARGAFGRC